MRRAFSVKVMKGGSFGDGAERERGSTHACQSPPKMIMWWSCLARCVCCMSISYSAVRSWLSVGVVPAGRYALMSEIAGLCGVAMTKWRSRPWATDGSFHFVVYSARGFVRKVVTPLCESSVVAAE